MNLRLDKKNVFVAPSRNIDHARPWEDEDGVSYKSSTGPSYNGKFIKQKNQNEKHQNTPFTAILNSTCIEETYIVITNSYSLTHAYFYHLIHVHTFAHDTNMNHRLYR